MSGMHGKDNDEASDEESLDLLQGASYSSDINELLEESCGDLLHGSSSSTDLDGWEEEEYADILSGTGVNDEQDIWELESEEREYDDYYDELYYDNHDSCTLEVEDSDEEKILPDSRNAPDSREVRGNGVDGGNDTNSELIPKPRNAMSKPYKNYDMHDWEQVILKRICISRVHDRIYYYDGHIQRWLDSKKFMRLIRDKLPDDIIRAIPSYAKMEEVYKFLCANPDIEISTNAADLPINIERVIVFNNGVFDVEKRRLLSFSKKYPVFFEIDAEYHEDEEECSTPEFDRMLDTISGGDEVIKALIYQMIGYLMMQGNEGKCFFVLGIEPNSGKSLLGEFIARLFDEEMVSNIPLTSLGERFAMGSWWKKAINVSMDLPTKTLGEEEVSKIKLLTGEKRINVEEKYEPVGTVFNHCKNIFATNGSISLKVDDKAFWDRLVFVPFMYSVEKKNQDRELLDKLWQERNGIASKAARAVKKLIENNFQFPVPESAERIVNMWKNQTGDSVKKFLEQECEFGCSYGEFSSDIFECYKKYCEDNGLIGKSQDALTRAIKQRPGIEASKKRKNGSNDNPIAFAHVR